MPVLSHDRQIVLLALGGTVPVVVAFLVLLWRGGFPLLVQLVLTVGVSVVSLVCILALRRRFVYPLQTISNLLAALRENDFSIRARDARATDALGTVMAEINALSDMLRAQRLDAQEATVLLRTVIAEIDVAILAFDNDRRLVLINRYGGHLLGQPEEALVGRRPEALGLAEAIETTTSVREMQFPGGAGRWEIRRRSFWQGGFPHELLVLSDVSQPLREQEREAWQRLIRVLGHELNNSLAPIKSIARSLGGVLAAHPPPDDWRDDMRRGLGVISTRADALSRFTGAYARLARLPALQRQAVAFGPLLHRLLSLETRLKIQMREGPPATVTADPDQLEQLLINVLQNAVDAALETDGGVATGWRIAGNVLEVWVEDEGPGLQDTANLFVPFFTTKPTGSGIGLVLSREIAEAHGGTLTLANRQDARGTRAAVTLPLRTAASGTVHRRQTS